MIYIGIDPDTKATGIGVLKGGKPVAALLCRASGRFTKDRAPGMIESLHRGLQDINNDFCGFAPSGIVEVAIEWQKIRAGEYARKAQNIADVLGVSYACLAVVKMVFPYAEIELPLPSEWKGTIPKAVHQKRVIRKLGLEGPNADLLKGMTKTNASHVIDGLGLALWLSQRR